MLWRILYDLISSSQAWRGVMSSGSAVLTPPQRGSGFGTAAYSLGGTRNGIQVHTVYPQSSQRVTKQTFLNRNISTLYFLTNEVQ
jgi:hypothetical protein